ncbi:hypothetical protein AcV5_005351 [Taiwanofungus camphoratus]|nr:hypothetical protein AcV5_005351 [Antrodia cinnamomea]
MLHIHQRRARPSGPPPGYKSPNAHQPASQPIHLNLQLLPLHFPHSTCARTKLPDVLVWLVPATRSAVSPSPPSTPLSRTPTPRACRLSLLNERTRYQYYSLATYASAGYNDFPTFSLNNGALIPNADNPKVQAVDDAPIDGAMIRFTGSNDGSPLKAGAQVYCVSLLSNYDYPVLAVNGDLSSFSICYEPEGPLLQYNVIYKATSGSSSYDYSTCYPVQLLAIIQ